MSKIWFIEFTFTELAGTLLNCLLCILFFLGSVSAQIPSTNRKFDNKVQFNNSYIRRNLVSNRFDPKDSKSPPFANIIDSYLINPWGVAIRTAGLGGHFWIANTGSSSSSEFVGDVRDSNGQFIPLSQDELKIVAVEGSPVGQVFSGSSTDFQVSGEFCSDDKVATCEETTASYIGRFTKPSRFIIATEEGKILAWSESRKSFPPGKMRKFEVVIDNSTSDALYRGLAISNRKQANWIYVANFASDAIEIYNSKWRRVNSVANETPFKKPLQIPDDYRPFNVQMVDNQIFVSYAQLILPNARDYDSKDPFAERRCAGCGFVAVFDEFGKFLRLLENNKKLNAPWGIAVAPDNFGGLSNTILVGNFGNGTITAFDRQTGNFIDSLRDQKGKVIKIDGLWAIFFGNGESLGRSDYLYWTAGYNDEKDGGFGSLNWIGAKNPNP